MPKLILTAVLTMSLYIAVAQDRAKAEALVREGIALHDRGEYDAAISKYDKAIDIDREYFLAW